MQVVSRRSAKAIGALLMLLAGSSCTLVEGRDMGPKFEHVLLTNDGTAVTNASVSVNGTTANLGADSKYHATLPSTVPVGGRLFVDVGSGPFAIHGLGRVPEAPVITAPADGASFAPAQPIPVTWTSATNPDRFQVNAEYSCGQNCSTSKRYDATGADRSLTIPAGDLPTDLPIVISVFAYNNGAFNSLAASGSTMNIRGEAFIGYPTITVAEPYHILGQDMSFKFEHVYVFRGTTVIDNATVSVNGTPAPVGADKGYHVYATRHRAGREPAATARRRRGDDDCRRRQRSGEPGDYRAARRRGVACDRPDQRDVEQRDGSRSVHDLGGMVLRPELRNRQDLRHERRIAYIHDSSRRPAHRLRPSAQRAVVQRRQLHRCRRCHVDDEHPR